MMRMQNAEGRTARRSARCELGRSGQRFCRQTDIPGIHAAVPAADLDEYFPVELVNVDQMPILVDPHDQQIFEQMSRSSLSG